MTLPNTNNVAWRFSSSVVLFLVSISAIPAQNAKPKCTLKSAIEQVTSAAVSQNGSLLLIGGKDGSLEFWDIPLQKKRADLGAMKSLVSSVAISPNNKLIAAGDWTGQAKVWDATTGKVKADLRGETVAFDDDSKALFFGLDRTLHRWDISGKEPNRLVGKSAMQITSIVFLSKSQSVVSGDFSGFVNVWNLSKGERELGFSLRTKKKLLFAPMAMSVNKAGDLLALACQDETVRLWSIDKKSETSVLMGHSDEVISVAFSPDGKWLASGSRDEKILIWDVAKATKASAIESHNGAVRCLGFSSNGKILVSVSSDGEIKIWEWESIMKKVCR